MPCAESVPNKFKKEKVETWPMLSSGHRCHLVLYFMFVWPS